MFFKKKKTKKIIVLIDLENISQHAVEKGQIVDFEALRNFSLSFGEIIFSFIFLPDHYVYSLPNNLNDLGFEIILCQKIVEGSDKPEDTVDLRIIQCGMKFIDFPEITDIVIVGHDKHMVHLIKEAKNRGKKISLIGTEKIAGTLKRIVDIKNIHDLPLKNKE